MEEKDRVILSIGFARLGKLCYIGTKEDAMQNIWNKLDIIAEELEAGGLDKEEEEFLVQRALYLFNELKQYYIGGKHNVI